MKAVNYEEFRGFYGVFRKFPISVNILFGGILVRFGKPQNLNTYQLICICMQQLKNKNNEKEKIVRFFRSPTLETVKMVEMIIKKYSGEFKKTQIWEKLPRKVMWPTYLIILNYLEESNRIIVGDDGIITYVWNPEGVRKYLIRSAY